jgi:hypothetical protein
MASGSLRERLMDLVRLQRQRRAERLVSQPSKATDDDVKRAEELIDKHNLPDLRKK